MTARPTIAFWPKTTENWMASYRIRCAQIRDALAAEGMETDLIAPSGTHPGRPAPRVLVLVKNFFQPTFRQAFAWQESAGTRLVLDICDNPFFEAHAGGLHEDGWEDRLAADLGRADLIVTPSTYLRDAIAARLRKDMRFAVIPDAVEKRPEADFFGKLANARSFLRLHRMPAALEKAARKGRRLIWFGISGAVKARNGIYDLEAYANILNAHDRREPLSLTIVTDRPARHADAIASFRCRTFPVPWNYWTVDGMIAAHDIALIPIRSNAYNLAKSANRVTTAFSNGAAVCATAIPSYEPFRGIACLDDWDAGLAALMGSERARQESVAAARTIIEREYSLPVIAGLWKILLSDLLDEARDG